MSKDYDNAVVVSTHNAAISQAADRLICLKDRKIKLVQDNPKPVSMEEVVW